ncbi:NucA/NucB deoxyribonuclease domain-containing protein [Streptomyces sp. SRF1]|uniref:NucA/NucB deoxyribonuclease domain-containing protein n=1 Tax=Streptomyces sp. SRF1 TaxID=1549642 RepID=UPI0025B06557|nr:NucA/NucB deoxyribonuclease domain-containing protein [Streptomyces sp. SRF1]MDN3061239.1 NucA/NucB deoxyribonuclease domain-containing protein [Streptomyces sp. SRF1]
MHRLVDAKKQQDDRDHSIAECNDVWGDYSGTDLQCDEYPFASTKEGSNKGDDRYSVRLIEGTDNESGGRRLPCNKSAHLRSCRCHGPPSCCILRRVFLVDGSSSHARLLRHRPQPTSRFRPGRPTPE